MRIIIDLQGAQAENRFRGIGRYSLSLAKAIARNRGKHEVILVLNALFPDSIKPICDEFDKILPEDDIHLWYGIVGGGFNSKSQQKNEINKILREYFIINLKPDFVLLTSFFEGLENNATTEFVSRSHDFFVVAMLYDIIPYIYQKYYLNNPLIKNWYYHKYNQLSSMSLLFAISDASRKDVIKYLCIDENKIVNISSAINDIFVSLSVNKNFRTTICGEYNINKKIILYTGGIDFRKNIEGLIKAYALLPKILIAEFQLVIVCSISNDEKKQFKNVVISIGLNCNDVVFTGFVPDETLVALYNIADVFVFPSKYEGFGLPVLEAMACGTATIGSNVSSIPEVIGREDALFDPDLPESISAKILQVLTDNEFRQSLEKHGLAQAKKFSWDISAKRAIQACEQLYENTVRTVSESAVKNNVKPTLAYVSPLPPERSGIADYSAELLPQLARYYDIIVIVEQKHISDNWINGNCKIQDSKWLRSNYKQIDRVLYHFGNSAFHVHMFDLLNEIPGVVVLHDFFLSGIQAHREYNANRANAWTNSLYTSHGYYALYNLFHASDTANITWKYPASFEVFEQAKGMIVHSNYARQLSSKWYTKIPSGFISVIPLLRIPCVGNNSNKLDNSFIICSFGLLGPAKLNHRLLSAWKKSLLSRSASCKLIFVGENHICDYGENIKRFIFDNNLQENVTITGWASVEDYKQYLASADVAVQLRTNSRGETSAAVLDCMNYGIATIVNANGSMAELPDDAVWKLPDEFTDDELVTALETLWKDGQRRTTLGSRARNEILTVHAPEMCAGMYHNAIEGFYENSAHDVHALVNTIANIEGFNPTEPELQEISTAIARNQKHKTGPRQLLVDISELVMRDVKSGIQRVTRSILRELIFNPPVGYRIEPVYATTEQCGYRYARKFTLRFLDCPDNWMSDDFIDFYRGDVFLGLDLQPQIVPAQQDFLLQMHNIGVEIFFVVYDILAIQHPECFFENAKDGFLKWIQAIVSFDGTVCISQSVANEVRDWVAINVPERLDRLDIKWFHLGADIDNSVPSLGLPDNAEQVLSQVSSSISFLMVGTVEPRKRQDLALDAFEMLWDEGVNVNLVIVGKKGWMVDVLCKRMLKHTENGKKFFWLEGISDEYLEKVYSASTCLVAASEGEGFGLPLIEAAQHKLPIIARDIPVFREVAGDHAFYFTASSGAELAASITEWIKLYKAGTYPKSDDMPWQTWKQSARQLLEAIGIHEDLDEDIDKR